MLIHLTTPTFDLDGAITIDALPDSSLGIIRRRMNRVATLDGGAVVNDSGYSESDRTIDLRWTPQNDAMESAVSRLVKLYARLNVSTQEGVFLVAVESYTPGLSVSLLSLLVIQKLS